MTPFDSIKYHKQLLQTSFAAMDPKTGEVKCWVGGIDYKWFKFDHITTKRQVGSTIKPLIYSLAVQDAGYDLSTVIPGGPVQYGKEVRTFTGGGGTLANCLAFSKNTASVRIANLVGVKRVVEFAKNCGIKAPLPPYISLALGSAEIPMLEMLQSYTMFPNKSLNTKPILYTRIEDKNGNILQEFGTESKQVMSESSAYTMVQLMQGVVQIGTARALNSYNIPVDKAGKTGTTNDNADGWFIGYTPELLAGTWVGCEDPFIRIYAGTSGGNEMAAPKWGIFMSKVYADKKLGYGKMKNFEKPAVMGNEELSGDPDFIRYAQQGDSAMLDQGNNDAGDYINEPQPQVPQELVPIESDIKPKADTNTKVKNKTDDKTTPKAVQPPPLIRPLDEKEKKMIKKEKEKTGGGNEY